MEQKIRPVLKNLSLGEMMEYPAIRGNQVRATANELKRTYGMTFKTKTVGEVVTVTRES